MQIRTTRCRTLTKGHCTRVAWHLDTLYLHGPNGTTWARSRLKQIPFSWNIHKPPSNTVYYCFSSHIPRLGDFSATVWPHSELWPRIPKRGLTNIWLFPLNQQSLISGCPGWDALTQEPEIWVVRERTRLLKHLLTEAWSQSQTISGKSRCACKSFR